MSRSLIIGTLAALLVAACGTATKDVAVDGQKGQTSKTPTRKPTAVLKKGGGFYKDDGPAEDIPDGLDDIPDAQPRWEPLHKPAKKITKKPAPPTSNAVPRSGCLAMRPNGTTSRTAAPRKWRARSVASYL